MTLNVNNQLTLLKDLLDEQKLDCCGNVSEYQQITRIVQSLMNNSNVTDKQLMQLLPEIHYYGKEGEKTQDIEQHITANNDNLNNWINAIHQSNLN
ncbi:MAG: YtzH-like family protein [Bacillota bacterium]|uniref:YtzH-like protein n=1 Tax=Virgibacillus salarius TaxID=447199 RepID=A0A941E0Y1_9BACI|nr:MULTISPECIES: YtzH-like family protein [Bacillaceae]NAZ10452.1 hypothetical protein [Agaribacter marinus]MBR7797743.1 hypothetical protein [Virgibacillus salarius]MCC2250100.1 YtzH-like family protein [Virgibacillus sp. AGTR]MDY7046253.1 YtzH-like family protein [Virgibacillus sp. M23]QRZ17751.1 hypothetical protein JUJ52_18705 [Virgibacillus sp. AGTR]